MKDHSIRSAAIVLTIAVMATPAWAGNYDFTFTDTSSVVLAHGVLHTSDTLNALGGYDVTGISGVAGGNAITGLISDPYSPNAGYYFSDGHISSTPDSGWEWSYDNTLYAGGPPYVDGPGLLFKTSTNIFNLYNEGGDALGSSPIGVWANSISGGTLSISESVPEPASWAMMLGGFGLIGGAMRSRRKAAVSFG